MNKRLLIITPAFNEQDNIEKVINNIGQLNLDGIDVDVDYVVVNDCSKDDTKALLKKLGAKYLDFPLNLGIGGAVQAGYKYAYENDYDFAVQMDGDGQHDGAYLKDLIEPLVNDEADCTIGSRFITNEGFQSTAFRRMGINFLSSLIKITCGTKIYDVTSGFRAVNRKLIKIFANDYAQDYPEPEAIVACVQYKARLKEVPVIMKEREMGESSIRAFKSLYYMIKVSLSIVIRRMGGAK